MKLSIVILNYKSAGLTRQCVKGIYAVAPKLEFEVIAVDNNSGDGCCQWLGQTYPNIRCITLGQNRGFAAGNNAGLREARGEYLLILNPDITVLPGQLEALVAFMDTHPKCGLAGPRLVNPDGSLQYSTYQFPKFWLPLFRRTMLGSIPAMEPRLREYQMLSWDHKQSRTVDWMLGACLIARKKAVEQVGLMDERYFLYVEDTDWCRRFWAQGWEVWYAAEIELVHFHERLSAQRPFLTALFNKITWVHIASWIKYFSKWRKGLTMEKA
ncbi:MAG: glycosyltransferase family 2 protein [Candidatus Veblenbacteria bacterium]|nr:glycosyltransferase family 2 protein [Candidatus Veblenbacteria bacterium]